MAVRVYFTISSPDARIERSGRCANSERALTFPGSDEPQIVTVDPTRKDTFYVHINDILLDELPYWMYGEHAVAKIIEITVREEVFVPLIPGHYTKTFHEKWKAETLVTKSREGYIVRISSVGYLPCRQIYMNLLAGELMPTVEYTGNGGKLK